MNLDKCYTCGGPTRIDPPGDPEVLVTCRNPSCGLTRLLKDTRADQPQFIVTWDTHAETHTVDSLREKYGKTNLFDDDGVWTNDFQMPDSRGSGCGGYSLLQHVLDNIVHGEQWVCDNCTVVLAGPACKTCGVENTRTGQCGDCSQVGRAPIETADEGEPFQWNEDGTLNKYPGEQDGGAA